MCKSKFIDSSKFNVNVYTEIMNVIDNNVYAGVFNVKNIINTILSCKKYKVRLIPLIKSIEQNLSQQIDIRKGNLYNYIVKLLIREYKDKNYKILNDTHKDSIVEVDYLTGEHLEVDLFFEEVGEHEYNLVEIKTRDNHDTGKKKSIIISLKKLTQRFREIFGKVNSYLVYMEEESSENIHINLDKEHIKTGKEFFEEYLDMDIEDLYVTIEDIVNRFDVAEKYVSE